MTDRIQPPLNEDMHNAMQIFRSLSGDALSHFKRTLIQLSGIYAPGSSQMGVLIVVNGEDGAAAISGIGADPNMARIILEEAAASLAADFDHTQH